ncbi:MAG: LamG-like jellyroll fold domain-containing protein [Bacteroidota bacterium]
MKKKNLLLSVVATIGLTAATMAQSVPSYLPTNGLVGWWPFNGNANDESGNGNNGTVNGATLTSDRNGAANSAFSLNGLSDYITLNNYPTSGNQSFSIFSWVKTPSIASRRQIISYGSNNTLQGAWFYIGVDSLLHFDLSFTNGPVSNIKIGNNSWHHVGVINNSGLIQLFVDGISSGISLAMSPNILTGGKTIGSSIINNNWFFNGILDDIGIWNRVLTQQEISDLYNSVNCSNNLTVNPSNNNLITGNQANFTATTSDPNPSFVWQSDFGQGFQTLNNYGNYSGVNSSSLSISNVQFANHNQPIRAISTSGNCIDTSNVAMIMIIDTCINTINDTNFITVTDTLIINATITGINPPNNQNTIKVFPNPASTHITINYGNFASMNGYQLKITNALGQQVFNTNITQQSDYIDLSTWSGNGVYFVHLIDPQGQTVDIRKIVLQ